MKKPKPPDPPEPPPPNPTNVLLLKMIQLQQELNTLMLEMLNEMRHCKHEIEEIEEDIEEIDENVEDILRIVNEILILVTPSVATDFELVQLKGDLQMPITGVQAGGVAAFTILLVPGNAAALQSGPTATSTDSLVTVSPNPNDPTNPFAIQCAVDASDANLSFDLKVDGVNSIGNAITHTFTIPILTAPPPVAVDFDLDQLTATLLKKK